MARPNKKSKHVFCDRQTDRQTDRQYFQMNNIYVCYDNDNDNDKKSKYWIQRDRGEVQRD